MDRRRVGFRRKRRGPTRGIAQSTLADSLLNRPATAHILGGAVIGADADRGVVDHRHRVFGYRNLLVCDGAAVPANPGVNPSLTITAMAERAMSFIEPASRATVERQRREQKQPV